MRHTARNIIKGSDPRETDRHGNGPPSWCESDLAWEVAAPPLVSCASGRSGVPATKAVICILVPIAMACSRHPPLCSSQAMLLYIPPAKPDGVSSVRLQPGNTERSWEMYGRCIALPLLLVCGVNAACASASGAPRNESCPKQLTSNAMWPH